MSSAVRTTTIRTRVPARLDRLPWSRFHWRVLIGLGTVWILDGLEVTIVGSVAARLTEADSGLTLTPGQIGLAAAFYVAGACLGALFFGQLTDRFGRKKLFLITLVVYVVATVATAFAFAPWYFFLARFVTGAGIGGEYAAINSAIDELIPARLRGRVDLIINGTFWAGAALGSALALVLLDTDVLPADVGWRVAFGLGAVLGFAILLVRRHVPESPRWLFIHGRQDEAERIVGDIEDDVRDQTGEPLTEPDEALTVRQRRTIPFRTIAHTAFRLYPRRAILGLALFVGQAFIYNSITFNLGTIFSGYFSVAAGLVPLFLIVYAVGNLLGPVTLGRLFDTVGRKPMIAGTYLGSAVVTIPLIWVFVVGEATPWLFLGFVVLTFFLASAGASAAYLTVSEIFPMETRALAIAFFYAVGTAVGGITGPLLFGQLIGTGDRDLVAIGFGIGAAVMAIGGVAELFLGVKAERVSLESIAKPLTAEEADEADGDGESAHRLRAEAENRRADAAEHRARAAELGETGGDATAEEVLADIAELQAGRLDELAAAAECRTRDGSAAAEHRARVFEERAAALAADTEPDDRRHTLLADAHQEYARAAEQRAEAARQRDEADTGDTADRDIALARAHTHDAWSDMHQAHGDALTARADADERAGARYDRLAAAAERRALGGEHRVRAAEHRGTAANEEARSSAAGRRSRSRTAAAERAHERSEQERRIRERLARRTEHERTGLRRWRPSPGPATGTWTGSTVDDATVRAAEQALDHEIEMIVRALDEHGPTDRDELATRVSARYWGPGRFRAALRSAMREGRIRQLSRRTFGPSRTR